MGIIKIEIKIGINQLQILVSDGLFERLFLIRPAYHIFFEIL